MPLFDELRVSVGPLWIEAQQHPFVDGLGDGSLPLARFLYFLEQDYVFLIGYSRAIALAAAAAPFDASPASLQHFAELLSGTLGGEMTLHRDYCARYGITADRLAQVEAAPDCQAYIDCLVATARQGGPLALLTLLTPCAVGYAEIGTRLVAAASSRPGGLPAHPYRQWIETYTSAEYRQYSDWVVKALNWLGAAAGAESGAGRFVELTELFRQGCRFERLFWELCWREPAGPVPAVKGASARS